MGKSKELAELGQVVSQSNGNVGIGTDIPEQSLHIKGSNYNEQLVIERADTSSKWGVAGAGNGAFQVYDINAGNATRMTIDASGRVTMPYQPAFSAFRNVSASTIYAGGTIVYPNYRFNVGNHYNLSTGVFTAPVDGRYQFNAHFMLHTTYANASNMYWGIVVNGVNYALINYGAASQDGGQTIASTIQLSAGDSAYVSLVSGSSIQTYGKEYHGFSGYLIG